MTKKQYFNIQNEILKKRYKKRFYYFVIEAFRVLHNDENLVKNWHLEYLCDLAQLYIELRAKKTLKNAYVPELEKFGFTHFYDLCINVPPRSLKSEIFSVFLIAWAWIDYPALKFLCNSHSFEKPALKLSKDTRKLLKSHWYISNFGDKISYGSDQLHNFENPSGGYRLTTSTNTGIQGSGANIEVLDDTMSKEMSRSDKAIQNVSDFLLEDLPTRFNDLLYDFTIMIEQRLITEDPTGTWISIGKKFNHVVLPAELTDDVRPEMLREKYIDNLLFPARLSHEILAQKRLELLTSFEGQYLQTPIKAGGNILKSDWFEIVERNQVPEYLNWKMYIDGAYTKNTKNDPTGILLAAMYKEVIYIKDFTSVYYEMPELIECVGNYVKAFRLINNHILYEPKASGISLGQMLLSTHGISTIPLQTPFVGKSKEERVNTIAFHCAAGRVKLIRGQWNSAFLSELESFPNGKHDEACDLLSYCVEEEIINRVRNNF